MKKNIINSLIDSTFLLIFVVSFQSASAQSTGIVLYGNPNTGNYNYNDNYSYNTYNPYDYTTNYNNNYNNGYYYANYSPVTVRSVYPFTDSYYSNQYYQTQTYPYNYNYNQPCYNNNQYYYSY